MPWGGLRCGIAGGFAGTIGRKWRGGFVFCVDFVLAVENIIRGHVHQCQVVLSGDGRELGWGVGVDGPGTRTIGFGTVDFVIGSSINDRLVLSPISGRGSGDVEFFVCAEFDVGAGMQNGAQSPTELTVGAGHQDFPGRHRGGVGKLRMLSIFVGNLAWFQRPVDHVQVDAGVVGIGRVMVVDQVCVAGGVVQRLEAIGDAARNEHGSIWLDLVGDGRTKRRRALPQVTPRAEDSTGGRRHEFIPGFSV